MGGPELHGALLLELRGIDCHHVLGTGYRSTLHRGVAQAAAAHDHHRVARGHFGPVHRRAVARGDPAADQSGGSRRDVGGDLYRRVDAHHHVLSERAQFEERGEVFACGAVVTEASRHHLGFHQVRAEVAQVLLTRGTPSAFSTGGDERARDVVADFELGHTRPCCQYHASSLVAADEGKGGRHRAVVCVFVGVAHPRSEGLDQDFAPDRIVELYLLDAPGRVGFTEDCGPCLHCGSFDGFLRSLLGDGLPRWFQRR